MDFLAKIFPNETVRQTVNNNNAKKQNNKGGFKVSASTGLYKVAADPQIQTLEKKVGYILTRGVSAIDIASDIFNEINFSEGFEIRRIAEHQSVDLTLHGSLQVPIGIPDRVVWYEAYEHIKGSLKSAIFGGCGLVNFHSSLNEWLEMITFAGRRLEISMCDWEGNPIRAAVTSSQKMKDWLVENEYDPEKSEIAIAIYGHIATERVRRALDTEIKRRERAGEQVTSELVGQIEQQLKDQLLKPLLRQFLDSGQKWYAEISSGRVGSYVLAYKIILHWMWLENDLIWDMMTKTEPYMSKLRDDPYRYNFDNPTADPQWLNTAIDNAFDHEDYFFKEFFYGAVAAKFLQGIVKKAFEWLRNELPKELEDNLKFIYELSPQKRKEEFEKFKKYINDIIIGFENPDARDPSVAGRYLLWRPRQIYIAIKATREVMKNEGKPYWNKLNLIFDFEQLAMQGVDPLVEMREMVQTFSDVGYLTKMIHANYPTPLHAHKPIEIADRIIIYQLLWELRKTGLGKDELVYLLFERGGGDDPFKGSIIALRAIAENLEKDIEPNNLPETFFAISEGTRDYGRQKIAVFQHAFEPLKGMLRQPEEEHTLLSTAALKAGKRPEDWLKEELR